MTKTFKININIVFGVGEGSLLGVGSLLGGVAWCGKFDGCGNFIGRGLLGVEV